jgi:hypothetical protein
MYIPICNQNVSFVISLDLHQGFEKWDVQDKLIVVLGRPWRATEWFWKSWTFLTFSKISNDYPFHNSLFKPNGPIELVRHSFNWTTNSHCAFFFQQARRKHYNWGASIRRMTEREQQRGKWNQLTKATDWILTKTTYKQHRNSYNRKRWYGKGWIIRQLPNLPFGTKMIISSGRKDRFGNELDRMSLRMEIEFVSKSCWKNRFESNRDG